MKHQAITITLVRHGVTQNNLEGRFCGSTDYPLTDEGQEAIRSLIREYPYPPSQWIVSSPAQRCRQTACLSFPHQPIEILEDLREMDFGVFEKRFAKELLEYPEYLEKWRRQDRSFSFLEGETFGQVEERGVSAFRGILAHAAEQGFTDIAIVTHSVVISLVLKSMSAKPPDLNDLAVPNGMGLFLRVEENGVDCVRPIHILGYAPYGAPRPDMSNSPYKIQKNNIPWREAEACGLAASKKLF